MALNCERCFPCSRTITLFSTCQRT